MSVRKHRKHPRATVVAPAAATVCARAPQWRARWCVLLLVATGLVTYANSLSNPFVFDDDTSITNNAQIRTLLSPQIFLPATELPTAGRPIVNASFAVNYAIGGINPVGYRLTNLGIHILCAVLIFGLVRLLLARSGGVLRDRSDEPVALAIALLWLVHPLNSEIVDYVTQRTESMMTLFYLLTLYAAVRAYEPRTSIRWSIVAVIACGLGMGSKESMVTAPLMVLLIDRVFMFQSFGGAFRARWRLYAGLSATWLLLAALVATGPRASSTGTSSGVSVWVYLLNQAPLITRYLRLTVWPLSLVANYGWPEPLRFADVWPAACVVLALLGLTGVLLKRSPRLGFLGAWFFLTLAPTSSLVPILTEVGAERRMYLPIMALIAFVVVITTWAWQRAGSSVLRSTFTPNVTRAIAAITLLTIVGAGMARTMVRNREYASPLRLAQVTVARYPSASARHVLAESLLAAGQRDEAIQQLRLALPGAPRAHYTLAIELYKDGQLEEAAQEFRTFIEAEPTLVYVINAHGYLGQIYAAEKNWPAAIEQFQELFAITPNNSAADHTFADILVAAGRYREAVPHYERYLTAYPNDAAALNQLGLAAGADGQVQVALRALSRAAAIDPQNVAVQHNLAMALYQVGDVSGALEHARQAVAVEPDNAASRELFQELQRLQSLAAR